MLMLFYKHLIISNTRLKFNPNLLYELPPIFTRKFRSRTSMIFQKPQPINKKDWRYLHLIPWNSPNGEKGEEYIWVWSTNI